MNYSNQTGYQPAPSSSRGGYQQPSYPSSGQYNTGILTTKIGIDNWIIE